MILRGGRSDSAPARGVCGDGVAWLMQREGKGKGEGYGGLCYLSGGFMVSC